MHKCGKKIISMSNYLIVTSRFGGVLKRITDVSITKFFVLAINFYDISSRYFQEIGYIKGYLKNMRTHTLFGYT